MSWAMVLVVASQPSADMLCDPNKIILKLHNQIHDISRPFWLIADDDSGEKSVSVLLSGEESEMTFIDHGYTEMTVSGVTR